MRKIAIFIAAVALLLLCVTPALANGIPKLPHAFYGSVTVNGAPAAAGTQISATVDIGEIIPTQNPVNTVGGSYGIGGNPYLLVQGYDIPDGATITFHVTNQNGAATGGTATFEAGGGPTEKNLSVTIAVPPPPSDGGGGGVGPIQDYVKTNIFGLEKAFRISDDGEVKDTIRATSEDGKLKLTIPKGTFALDKDGEPLESLEAAINESPPEPPVNAQILLAYDFGPAGATFDPPITLTWAYDPDELPVAEEDLAFVYYSVDGEWVELDFEIDTKNNTITASIEHFTTFAVVSMPPASFTTSSLDISPGEVSPAEKVNISVSVANTGAREGSYTVVLEVNGEKEAEKSVTLAARDSDTFTFTVSKTELGTYTVAVDGLTGSFTVVAPPEKEEVTPPEKEEVTPPEKEEVTPPEKEEAPAAAPWYQIFTGYWGILVAGVAVIIVILLIVTRRRRD